MSDPELLKLTASEPLSLDQEYEMQETWRNDEDSTFIFFKFNISLKLPIKYSKHLNLLSECTFLVLNKDTFERTQDEIGSKEFNHFITECSI